MLEIFHIIFYQPLFNALLWIYSVAGNDLGIAVIVLTVLIKIILFPLGARAIRSQKTMAELQPKIKEIQEKYKNNKEEQAKAVMDFYKKEKINPFSGILPSLIQLPILIALYWVFMSFKGDPSSASAVLSLSTQQIADLYSFIHISSVSTAFLGFLNLIKPSIVLAILAGVLQFLQVKMVSPKIAKKSAKNSDFAMKMQTQMQYFLPIFTIIILTKLSAAIGLYWVTTTLFTIGQQYFLSRKKEQLPKEEKSN
jgi:YidC/Oxa1 family membrane protein insertase